MSETVTMCLAIAMGWCLGYLSCLALEVERKKEDPDVQQGGGESAIHKQSKTS